jgi:uncharacterized membrane protein
MKKWNWVPNHYTTAAVVLLGLVFSFSVTAVSISARGAEEVIEEAGEVEVVAQTPVDAKAALPSFTVMQVIGRNHPALVHFPIGLVIAVCLIEFLSFIRPGLDMGKSGLVLSIFTVLSFLAAAVSGFIRAGEVFAGRTASELLVEHRLYMIVAASIFTVSLAIRAIKKDQLNGWIRYAFLLLLAASALLTAIGGHHGGQLVYGDTYLPY